MNEYLISLYETATIEKKSLLHKIYQVLLFLTIVLIAIFIFLKQYVLFFMISILILIVTLSVLDKKNVSNKYQWHKKKQRIFYEIFYPEILSELLHISFKFNHQGLELWPFQQSFYKPIVHLTHKDIHIVFYQFHLKQTQKPQLKVLIVIPLSSQPLTYLNHRTSIDEPYLYIQHHYLYHVNEKDKDILNFIEKIDRCPHLMDIEIIMNGQDAMFMCKIEHVLNVDDIQMKEQTFKKHQKNVQLIQPVYHYLKETIKEFEDAHRK